MMPRLPVLPTLVVLIAVGIMIRLGFWQLDRMHQKEAMLARFTASQAMSAPVQWRPAQPQERGEGEIPAGANLYRRSSLTCLGVAGIKSTSGQNDRGMAGYAHTADCLITGGSRAPVVLGWSPAPAAPAWTGGPVTGWIAPGPRLVADPPLAGLAPNARPDPRDIPNNHFAYAVQWFAFAAVALVIYALALRSRRRHS